MKFWIICQRPCVEHLNRFTRSIPAAKIPANHYLVQYISWRVLLVYCLYINVNILCWHALACARTIPLDGCTPYCQICLYVLLMFWLTILCVHFHSGGRLGFDEKVLNDPKWQTVLQYLQCKQKIENNAKSIRKNEDDENYILPKDPTTNRRHPITNRRLALELLVRYEQETFTTTQSYIYPYKLKVPL